MTRIALHVAVLLLAALPVAGEDSKRLIFGLGYDDVRDYREPSEQVTVDIEWGEVPTLSALKWRAGAMAMLDGDVWLGAGVSYRTPTFGGPWFFEATFGPGLYYRDDEAPGIGHLHFPMFRTQGGFGYTFENGGTVAFLLSHLSDGGLDLDAGSSEAVILTYSRKY